MKNKHIILPAILFAMIALISCETRSKTTSKLEGSWTSVPRGLPDKDFVSVDVIDTYDFAPTTDTSGDIIVSEMISIEQSVPESPTFITPYAVTAAGIASMSGTFETTSYDKVEIKLDPSTYHFEMDSAAVRFQFDALDSQQVPAVGDMKPQTVENLKAVVSPMIKEQMSKIKEISSVKFTESMLAGNIDGVDVTLRHQPSN